MFERFILVVWVLLGALAAHSAKAADTRQDQWMCDTPDQGSIAVKVERVGNVIDFRDRMLIGSYRTGVLAMIDELDQDVYADRYVFRGASRTATAELEIARVSRKRTGIPAILRIARIETRGPMRVPLNVEIELRCSRAR